MGAEVLGGGLPGAGIGVDLVAVADVLDLVRPAVRARREPEALPGSVSQSVDATSDDSKTS